MSQELQESLLGGYRVLDLSDQTGVLMGRILADMGADVIKIEKPGGDPIRDIGPFYQDEPGPERSLYWFLLNANKRSVTLDIEKQDGREIFKKLVKTADFIIECFAPGYMTKLGLGYEDLEKINPNVIVTSITPFGQTGPYANWKGTDIVVSALGGLQWLCGDPDRPPVRMTTQASHFETSLQAAAAVMIAHYYREITGEGQHIDISMQEALSNTLDTTTEAYDNAKQMSARTGTDGLFPPTGRVYPCKDGYITRWPPEDIPVFLEWMEEIEEINPEFKTHYLREWQVATKAGNSFQNHLGREEYRQFKEATSNWFMKFTKKELHEGSQARHFGWAPCYTLKEVLEGEQLVSRNWLVEVEHPELDATLTYPGVLCRLSEAPMQIRRRAPLIGEHNEETYEKELGLSEEELILLRRTGVI